MRKCSNYVISEKSKSHDNILIQYAVCDNNTERIYTKILPLIWVIKNHFIFELFELSYNFQCFYIKHDLKK